MLKKILGVLLLVLGIALGLKMLVKVLGFLFAVLVTLFSVALVGVLIAVGWRLLKH